MALRINIPPLTRVLLVLLVGLSVVYQAASFKERRSGAKSGLTGIQWIALTPVYSIYYPWTYVTATFAERNVFTLLIAGATLFYGGKYLERAWGSSEFGKFFLIVTLVPNVAVSLLWVLLFAVTGGSSHSWNTIQGSIAIQAAFLVAFKQLVPEHTVTILKGIIKIRVKHFPAIFLAASTVLSFVFLNFGSTVLAWLGFMTSWTYLRFYKKQVDLSGTNTGGSTLRGDASETFSFAYFWPDIVHGPVAMVSDAVFNVLVMIKICTPFSATEVETSNEQASARGEGGLPSLMNPGGRRGGGGKREEAERRRALALKALDQRLQAATASRQQTVLAAPTPNTSSASPPVAEVVDGQEGSAQV